jgi:hypothetical protein
VKILTAYILLALVVFQLCVKLVVYVNFKIQQDYYAKNECVKKDIVNNDCEGNCCLKKQLATQEKKAPTLPNIIKQKIEMLYVATSTYFTIAPVAIIYKLTHHIHYTKVMLCNDVDKPIKPPRVLVL